MQKHFVKFLSPGTMVAEETTKEIDSWNVETAMSMARGIKERHSATPYGFYFITRSRGDDELDSKVTKSSGTYYLGGEVHTVKELKAKNDPTLKILIQNMITNGYKKVITNKNSWNWTQPLGAGDTVLDWEQ